MKSRETVFPRKRADFSRESNKDAALRYSTPHRLSFPRWLATRGAQVNAERVCGEFRDHFSFGWTKERGWGIGGRNERRHEYEEECKGKNSSVHSAVRYVRHTYVFVRTSFTSLSLFFSLSLLCPTLPKELARSFKVAAWLFVPATQTQFAFRPLSFLHDTLRTWHLVCVCITVCVSFFSSGRSVNFFHFAIPLFVLRRVRSN